jgi:uncharacterized LabA/DUF88 family protein
MPKEGGNYAYIDGTNLHKGIQQLGWELDYARFRIFLKDHYAIEKAYLFLGFVPKNTAMYEKLQSAGYVLVFKQTIINLTGIVKGNCDGELIVQAMSDFYEKQFEKAILVTGDGDFACLVSFLRQKGGMDVILSPNRQKCSLLLKRTGAKITFLEEQREKLEFHKSPK